MSVDSAAGASSMFTTKLSENNELTVCKESSIDTGCECQGITLPSLELCPKPSGQWRVGQKHINGKVSDPQPAVYKKVTNFMSWVRYR